MGQERALPIHHRVRNDAVQVRCYTNRNPSLVGTVRRNTVDLRLDQSTPARGRPIR